MEKCSVPGLKCFYGFTVIVYSPLASEGHSFNGIHLYCSPFNRWRASAFAAFEFPGKISLAHPWRNLYVPSHDQGR